MVATEGWAEVSTILATDLVRRFEDAGAAAIIYTDIERDGMLGGVNLDQPVRAVGTEPFWGVSIDTEAVVYSGVDQAERRGANDGVVVQGTTATWSVQPAQGQPFTVTLMATECSDGMSDRLYPLTALVEMGETRLNGCAAPAAALLQEQAAG